MANPARSNSIPPLSYPSPDVNVTSVTLKVQNAAKRTAAQPAPDVPWVQQAPHLWERRWGACPEERRYNGGGGLALS